jgi:SAM-dependent methyltransferase
MRVLKDTAELDEMIVACNRAEAESDDAMRALFQTFRMEPPPVPDDPFSAGYREAQMALYERIAGRAYSAANEVTSFDVEAALNAPFPYSTRSCATAGEHFHGIGMLLRMMALKPGSRVLEFGPGWGNTTVALAKLGHKVTAVDIEPRFCDLLRRRAQRERVQIEVVQGDFLWVEGVADGSYDAVVFFECFHHCADHLRLLAALRAAVAPGGAVYFGAEPIRPDFPMPWGVRLDGSSLWAIRKNGWLELGFRDDYFRAALERTGWSGRRVDSADLPWMSVWEARPREGLARRWPADSPEIRTKIGEKRDRAIVFNGTAGAGAFGPYASLPAGRWVARLVFRARGKAAGRAKLDVTSGGGTRTLVDRSLAAEEIVAMGYVVELPFDAEGDLDGVEVRLFCQKPGLMGRGFQGPELLAVEINPRG